ncbi:MAG: twin-arginine translocase subunit TatC [Bacteroidia bacterium]
MSFLEHLEELRWHLMRALVAIVVVAIAVFVEIKWVFDSIIVAPTRYDFPLYRLFCKFQGILCEGSIPVRMQAIKPYEQFVNAMVISAILGLIVAFPYVLWEIWRFIKPGLRDTERKAVRGNVFVMSMLFFMGVLFSYYVVLPLTFQFLATWSISDQIENDWRFGDVVGMVTQVVLAGGILFEMPVLAYYLSKMGLLTPAFMKTYRRHAVVVLLILAAILTPPDPGSQILIFIPLMLLYEVSIMISSRVAKRRERELAGA